MKPHLTTIFIALIVGYLGGISSQVFQSESTPVDRIQEKHSAGITSQPHIQTEPGELTLQVEELQQKTDWLEMQLNEIVEGQAYISDKTEAEAEKSTDKRIHQPRRVEPNKDDLVSAGVNPDVADDLLRRISHQKFRRMELQNLIRRNASSGARQYRAELRELDKNKISLRSELGDYEYDQYLVASGQNNRVKVSSVMAGSPAEISGFQKDDVILYYDDKKILNNSDLRKATLEGDIGNFTNVEILRDGAHMSLMVSRGTLGVQLQDIRLDSAR